MKRTSQCSDINPRVQRRVSSVGTPRGRAYLVRVLLPGNDANDVIIVGVVPGRKFFWHIALDKHHLSLNPSYAPVGCTNSSVRLILIHWYIIQWIWSILITQ